MGSVPHHLLVRHNAEMQDIRAQLRENRTKTERIEQMFNKMIVDIGNEMKALTSDTKRQDKR